MTLSFDNTKYEIKNISQKGETITVRAFEHIPYCVSPLDPILERLSIYAPEAFFHGEKINGYGIENAPIFMPNTVGGYMPGPEEAPGPNFMGETNASFYAIQHGYVVVSASARGRGCKGINGDNVGIAPADIVDLKAAVRFIRSNKKSIPGDTEKIITNGTSAGGAMSALLGSTGNHPDYSKYLEEIGAVGERDDVFASSCYCPITNLENADIAYEWEFNGINDYHRMMIEEPENGMADHPDLLGKPDGMPPKFVPVNGELSREQQRISGELCERFPEYLNSLSLRGANGENLSLNADGEGSFLEMIKVNILRSAQNELDLGKDILNEKGVSDWLTVENGKAAAMDWKKFVLYRTRMKEAPAFDNVSMGTAENELFGSESTKERHFTSFSKENDTAGGTLAEEGQIKLMNPMNYIEDDSAVKAKHFRIRHGAVDRDTSLAISEILNQKLVNSGIDSEIAHPWGIPHSGDYDLPEMFAWIDSICK